jgi:hypothetical protein
MSGTGFAPRPTLSEQKPAYDAGDSAAGAAAVAAAVAPAAVAPAAAAAAACAACFCTHWGRNEDGGGGKGR